MNKLNTSRYVFKLSVTWYRRILPESKLSQMETFSNSEERKELYTKLYTKKTFTYYLYLQPRGHRQEEFYHFPSNWQWIPPVVSSLKQSLCFCSRNVFHALQRLFGAGFQMLCLVTFGFWQDTFGRVYSINESVECREHWKH